MYMRTYWYEIHVTVKDADPEEFVSVCSEIGVKPVLLHFQTVSKDEVHDMMTSSKIKTTESEVYRVADAIAGDLAINGMKVARVKIETEPRNPLAYKRFEQSYFESHIQVSVDNKNVSKLHQVAKKHGAHMSQNVFKLNKDGTSVIMVTLRKHGICRSNFEIQRDRLANDLSSVFQIGKLETEFILYDTNEAHDNTWIQSITESQ